MRLVTVKAPAGVGKNVAQIAFAAGITQVTFREAKLLAPKGKETLVDMVDVETATPRAKAFIEDLMANPIYNPDTFTFTIRHPEALFATERPDEETDPIVRPTTDVYQELWQFTEVTVSLVARTFFSAVLLAFGMVEGMIPLIIAGLLFLPYHHHMLAIALGSVTREWRFLGQGFMAILVSTVLIMLGGVCVALFTEPPIQFQEFGSLLSGAVLSAVIGSAAAFAAMDDAGRRELVGLAATAHISIYPAWFGLKLVFGFQAEDKIGEHLLTFGLNVTILILAALLTFALMGMRGDGIRRFVKQKTGMA